jgi:hypothetical protein
MCEAGGRIVLPDDARNKDELTSALWQGKVIFWCASEDSNDKRKNSGHISTS